MYFHIFPFSEVNLKNLFARRYTSVLIFEDTDIITHFYYALLRYQV